MKLTQIRNATIRMIYAGNVFLIDPWLAPKHQLSFVDIPGRPFHVPDPVKRKYTNAVLWSANGYGADFKRY